MQSIGIFAGRGDVILMMFICLLIGFIAGIKTNRFYLRFRQWVSDKRRSWRGNAKNNPTLDKA